MSRGQLRVYLGYAPGVGTTCALLDEGQRRARDGADVVVACAQTHGRPGPSALLAGLEIVSPARVPQPGTVAGEMDLGAVLARRPEIALVDDLAHDRGPGSGHRARWQDVEDLLTAGIDVISAVGIGQLDSLADAVQKITGVPQPETVPDPVVHTAGEVQLVDIAPEELQDRMARGSIFPPDQAQAALAGWFRIGNLSALRELALLWLAAKLASDPQRYRPGGQVPGSGSARERVLVALDGGPEGQTLIRRAARIAARSEADLLAVHVARPDGRAGTHRATPAAAAAARPAGRRYLPPGDRGRHSRGAAGLRPRGRHHPAGARRGPPHRAGRALAGHEHPVAGDPPRRRNRRTHHHLRTHSRRHPPCGARTRPGGENGNNRTERAPAGLCAAASARGPPAGSARYEQASTS